MDWRIIFFDDTLEERFLSSTERSLLLGDLLKNIEDNAGMITSMANDGIPQSIAQLTISP